MGVLSIGVHKGSRIAVGASILEVTDIAYGQTIHVLVDGRPYQVTDQQRVKILEDVYLSYGMGRDSASSSRLAFEAPRSISITRQ